MSIKVISSLIRFHHNSFSNNIEVVVFQVLGSHINKTPHLDVSKAAECIGIFHFNIAKEQIKSLKNSSKDGFFANLHLLSNKYKGETFISTFIVSQTTTLQCKLERYCHGNE